ncbi:hypothetical protein CPC16_005675 [Podila verticillata]|nr:hypothetical protein BGZ52_010502 [Haplosporangium bisporale]KAF9389655.1 hypothetical protein CPC16_005675 [Podila verticillata]
MKLLPTIATLAVIAVTHARTLISPYPVSGDCASPGTTDQIVTDFNLTPSDYCIGKSYTVTTTGSLVNDVIDVIAPAKITITASFSDASSTLISKTYVLFLLPPEPLAPSPRQPMPFPLLSLSSPVFLAASNLATLTRP